MSWSSRLGSLGRFSPFTRSPPQGSTQVSDSDFSYITAEDLKRVQGQQQSSSGSQSQDDMGPQRDTDVLVLRNKRQDYTVHFPAYSIARGELSVGQVRQSAAKKMGAEASRVKLLYKGKNLKDDARLAKMEGLRDHAELLVTLSDSSVLSASDSEDDSDDGEGVGVTEDGETAKRRRNRNKNKKRRGNKKVPQQQAAEPPNLAPQTSGPPPPKQPVTNIDKLNAARATLGSYEQEVRVFMRSPPADRAKRDFEHKRLSEMILTQVLLKLDAVETDGDEDLRKRRKDVVRECQNVLKELDDFAKL